MRHAHRTVGFSKIKGININHSEFEDFIFRIPEINDFKVEFQATDGLDELLLSVEISKLTNSKILIKELSKNIKDVFEVKPMIIQLESGTLAQEFELSVKAPRFVDTRT